MAFDFDNLSASEKVTAVYVAYYGRAADSGGRSFWSEQLEQSGGDLSAIIDAFGTSSEAVQRFGTLSNEAAVRTLFRDLFNHDVDQAGLDFYVGELEAGRLTLQTIALDVLNGAQNADAAIAANKVAAGESYTDALVATGATAEIEDTRLVVAGVDDTEASVAAAQTAIEAVTGQRDGVIVHGDVFENGSPVSELTAPVGPITVAGSSAGFLGVTGGTSPTFDDDVGTLSVGSAEEASGTVLVSGSGSTLVARGPNNFVNVDGQGKGVLLVSDGAHLETLQLIAGRSGQGEVLVAGSDTRILATPANGGYDGEFSDEGGFVQAGRNDGSYGRIVLSDGALLEVAAPSGYPNGPGMTIARNAGSRGEVIVDGATARFTQDGPTGDFGPYLNVGRGGRGTLDVRNEALVSLGGNDSNLAVGMDRGDGAGAGTLSITGGSRVESLFSTVASGGGTGDVIVAGPGSILALQGAGPPGDAAYGNGGFMNLGRDGTGTLRVEDGGTVSISTVEGATPGLHAGRNEGSQGTITVTGQDSTISIANTNEALTDSYVAIGRGGEGALTIADGGTFEGALFMHVGRDATASGSVNISGANSLLEMSGSAGPERDDAGQGAFLTVGRNGDGDLRVENGGAIAISAEAGGFYPGLALGFFEESKGTMVVTGAGSSVTVSGGSGSGFGSGGIIHIGRQGDGDLTVSDGGTLTNSDQGVLTVGLYPTGQGSMTVTGDGAAVDAGLQVLLGSFADFETGEAQPDGGGTGEISVGAGGRLEAGDAALDGIADFVVGANATLRVESGGTLVGDVRVVGGNFDLADGATHQGEVIA